MIEREAMYDWHRAKPETLDAMAFRCEEEGHDWRGAATIFLQVYKSCRWCGAAKGIDRSEKKQQERQPAERAKE